MCLEAGGESSLRSGGCIACEACVDTCPKQNIHRWDTALCKRPWPLPAGTGEVCVKDAKSQGDRRKDMQIRYEVRRHYKDGGEIFADGGYVLSRTNIEDLKLDKDGEIKDYYNKDSDRLLYEALRARLAEYDGDGKKAFAEKFYKPKSRRYPRSCCKKVKTYKKCLLAWKSIRMKTEWDAELQRMRMVV